MVSKTATNSRLTTCLRPDAATCPVKGLERHRFEGFEFQREGVGQRITDGAPANWIHGRQRGDADPACGQRAIDGGAADVGGIRSANDGLRSTLGLPAPMRGAARRAWRARASPSPSVRAVECFKRTRASILGHAIPSASRSVIGFIRPGTFETCRDS